MVKLHKLINHESKKQKDEDAEGGSASLAHWFYSSSAAQNDLTHTMTLPRKTFGKIIGQWDYHEVHPQTGSILAGKQLLPEQILLLTRVIQPNGGEISLSDVIRFRDSSEDFGEWSSSNQSHH